MDQQTNIRKAVSVVFDRALAEQLDDWRRRQPQIPTTAEGIRRLVARAIASEHVSVTPTRMIVNDGVEHHAVA